VQIKTSGEKILLVDDVKVVRSVYRQALENAGFQVVEAIDFEDAISQFDSSIDLAMVDIVLEGKSGLEILSHIRKQQPLCPVIMISGHANKNNAIDALHKGAVDYLEKPINLHELVHVAERWLSYRTLEEENIRLHEEQKLQHELRASQLHYDHLVEAIPDGILLACEGRIVYANSAAARILKATDRDTLIGSELLELAGPERRKSIADHIKHALQEQSPVAGLEGRLLRLNGQAFDAEFSISHTDHLGRDAVQLMFRDITDRKRTEKALCDSRERFTGIVESIPDAVVSIDESQKIIVFNRGAEKTFGYRRDEALGQSLGILIPKEFHERHRRHVDDFAASGTARSAEMRSEVVALRKSGEEFPVIASISKITVAGQQILTTIMHDITERKQAEAAIITSRSRLESIIDTSNDLIFLKTSGIKLPTGRMKSSLISRWKR
jgi:PAS domain S-box-containing protein